MANYETLKAAIQAVIKQNGNNEITGSILQSTLVSMIESFGVGYQFAGIANPTTNPGTPDQKVYYLVASPGAYPNFGAINVLDGEIAVISGSGSAWEKTTLFSQTFDVNLSATLNAVGTVAKIVGDEIYIIGTNAGNTLDFYFGILENRYLLLSYSVEKAVTGGNIPPNVIFAAGGNYVFYWAGTSLVKFNIVSQSLEILSTMTQFYETGIITYDPNVGITFTRQDGTSPIVVMTNEELESNSAQFAFGVATNTNMSNVIKFSYRLINQFVPRQIGQNKNGVNLRCLGANGFVKPVVPVPMGIFGDSIVSEYFVDPANSATGTQKCVLAWYINENLGLNGVREVFTDRSTISGKSTLTDADGNIVMIRRGYPDETFSNEHSHNGGCLQNRIGELVSLSPKSIVIMGGTNDFGYNCTIGDVDSVNPATTCGGLNLILQSILENLPYCQVFVCTPIPRASQFTPNNQGKILADYVNAIKEVARRYSAKIIDLYSSSGIYYANEVGNEHIYLIDGIHPNLYGFEKMTRIIANSILENI